MMKEDQRNGHGGYPVVVVVVVVVVVDEDEDDGAKCKNQFGLRMKEGLTNTD